MLTPRALLCVLVQVLWHPPGAQFSKLYVLCDNFVQQGARNLWEMTKDFRNYEATILNKVFPHKLHKIVRNVGGPPTALLIVLVLSTCCKLSAPATHHLLAHDVSPIDMAELTMTFDRRYALCIQNVYHRPNFTVGGSWNKSLHLQPLQRCF